MLLQPAHQALKRVGAVISRDRRAVEGEAVLDGAPLAVALGHIAPGSAGAKLPEDTIARRSHEITRGAVVAARSTGRGRV
jgi:hypothetical protein